jgi:hypothetical protein
MAVSTVLEGITSSSFADFLASFGFLLHRHPRFLVSGAQLDHPALEALLGVASILATMAMS